MANDLVKSPANACTLYELEDNLQALANTIALAEEECAGQIVLEEIGVALRKNNDKRDAAAAFFKHCEQQRKFARRRPRIIPYDTQSFTGSPFGGSSTLNGAVERRLLLRPYQDRSAEKDRMWEGLACKLEYCELEMQNGR